MLCFIFVSYIKVIDKSKRNKILRKIVYFLRHHLDVRTNLKSYTAVFLLQIKANISSRSCVQATSVPKLC